MTRLPSSAAVLAACTTSFGCAFLHSTCTHTVNSKRIILYCGQCCGSGSARIRNFLQDPDPYPDPILFL
jgi:hypothetical protein